MLGRDLISYIYENNLLDEEVFKKGRLIGHLSEDEAAKKFGVGISTIKVWVNQGKLNGIRVNDTIFVPYDSVDPRIAEVDDLLRTRGHVFLNEVYDIYSSSTIKESPSKKGDEDDE